MLQQLQRKNQELTVASRLLSAPDNGIADVVRKLLETNHVLEKSLADAQEELLAVEAKILLGQQQHGIVKAQFTERTVQQLQKLARSLVAGSDDIIVLLVTENGNRLQFVAARGASVETSMKQISSVALPLINGKGGGNDAFVQGGGEPLVTAEQFLTKINETLVNPSRK
ncbi:DHHA1 domain-containing protein [Sporosarcina sp. JAI121]|uniref:DHHA1 domain-containing protein n=1 Tax=Sporosarcina sp. JAI121 TaxID=2723064 RepID=UPI00185910C1|nr:alanyl-tRNA synthetase [Sporosarcina sp. JAI121]